MVAFPTLCQPFQMVCQCWQTATDIGDHCQCWPNIGLLYGPLLHCELSCTHIPQHCEFHLYIVNASCVHCLPLTLCIFLPPDTVNSGLTQKTVPTAKYSFIHQGIAPDSPANIQHLAYAGQCCSPSVRCLFTRRLMTRIGIRYNLKYVCTHRAQHPRSDCKHSLKALQFVKWCLPIKKNASHAINYQTAH